MDDETIIKTKVRPSEKTYGSKIETRKIQDLVRSVKKSEPQVSEIIFLTSYPPRECGIATYSKDLERALSEKFGQSFNLKVLPLESKNEQHQYPKGIEHVLNTNNTLDFQKASHRINSDTNVGLVLIQHEFGLFKDNENTFLEFLEFLDKPIVITFHTILPEPTPGLKHNVQRMSSLSDAIIVMTQTSAEILTQTYGVRADKITVVPHGTHLVLYENKDFLKEKYGLSGKKVLSTFGLLGPGKSIETTLQALPTIVTKFPETLFLIIGRTHPTLVKEEGEIYRNFLEAKIDELGIAEQVRFVNEFVPLDELLEYLQLTDIYLFTSKDPHQAVSGTFSYALSCGCPVISTPIPHALEVLQNGAGIVFDFEDSGQLERAVIQLLENDEARHRLSLNGLNTSATSAWENAAIAHAKIFEKLGKGIHLKYSKPPMNLKHIKNMTTEVGIIQFSDINRPDMESGYTLDDNARALIALCQHYQLTGRASDLKFIKIYFKFIRSCFRYDATFLNYVDKDFQFTEQNRPENLEDACGRAIWALGYLLSVSKQFPEAYRGIEDRARFIFEEAIKEMEDVHSPRSMAFVINGLYHYSHANDSKCINPLVTKFADRLVQMYRHEAKGDWSWFESYLTYGNAILPHAMLMAYAMTLNGDYRKIAKSAFDFLLSKIMRGNNIRVISNKSWLKSHETLDKAFKGGEQPIDVAYTILALRFFHSIFPDSGYEIKMQGAFDWFLGENPLKQTIYNPCTGGCYDGLELHNVNLNQGAESTLSYLLARMAFEDFPLQWKLPGYRPSLSGHRPKIMGRGKR
ncbi:MAG TPA: glycosyltransferase [Pricia sp.]|nr:glycosyltransferase [Pricia sp.]